MARYRICRRYSPLVGTWYVIQRRFLFWWLTYDFAFDELVMTNQMLRYMKRGDEDLYDICDTPLEEEDGVFVERYPCKTRHVRAGLKPRYPVFKGKRNRKKGRK